jgi:hypothetical protein
LGKDEIKKMSEKRLSHAYMVVGADNAQREQTVIRLAAAMVCGGEHPPCGQCRDCKKAFAGIHPDVIQVDRQAGDKGQLHREILVEQIRQITADAVVAPNEANRKVYVIRQADKMNTAAQNALLKALEEPPGHACFILCATAADALLPTVRSRCVRLEAGEHQETLEPLSDFAREYLQLAAQGNVADVTLFCMLRTKLTREEAEAFFQEVEQALGDILCSRRPNPGLSREQIFHLTALVRQGADYLGRNVSPKQVFGVLATETLR